MLGKRVKLRILPKTLLRHTLWGTPSLKEGWDLVTGCDRLGSSRWTRCMLKGSFELAGWVTRDFLKLGEGHDTEEFAQSCEQRALEGFVLERWDWQGPNSHYTQPQNTECGPLYNVRLCTDGAAIQSFTRFLQHTVQWPSSHAGCILTSAFC